MTSKDRSDANNRVLNPENRIKEMKNTVYIISGPTASGKSLIAYYLAKRIRGEVVNCDSVQLYKYMDIGSAKLMLILMLSVVL